MKFNLTEGEVKNILEMHSKVKKEEKVISEQITNLANMSGIELANMRRGNKLAFDASYNGLSALQKKIVDDKIISKIISPSVNEPNEIHKKDNNQYLVFYLVLCIAK